jgi:hypothetical protein
MDWNAVAAWAEVAGAMAVVISLVYLAAQIRQGNSVAKAAGQESVVNAFRNFTQPIAQDPDLYRLFHRGVEEFDSLEGDDRGRFFHLAFQFGKVFESAHFHYTHGLLDEGTWVGWRNGLAHYAYAPGWKKYWALRSDLYSPEFCEFVANLPVPERRASASVVPPSLEG